MVRAAKMAQQGQSGAGGDAEALDIHGEAEDDGGQAAEAPVDDEESETILNVGRGAVGKPNEGEHEEEGPDDPDDGGQSAGLAALGRPWPWRRGARGQWRQR